MRKALFHIAISLILFVLENAVFSQIKQPSYVTKKASVAVLARSKGDSVLIRWAPDDPLLWKAANKYGYRVVRIKVAENDTLLFGEQRTTVIIADSIRPYPLNKIEPLIEKDRYAAIVGQAIYGEDFEISASFEKNPSELFDKSRELQDRFSFALFSADQSALAAKVHGLWYTDKTADRNARYMYAVFPLIPANIIDFDTAYTIIAVNDTMPLPKPYDVSATFGDKFVELSWNREYLQRFYSSYFVERSDDDGKTFIRTSESPFLNINDTEKEAEYIYRVDSLPENNKLYLFRIVGISPFGETGPPSDAIAGMGASKSDFVNPIISKNEVVGGTLAYIEWEIMESSSQEVIGFEVNKSINSEGPYTSITPEYLDEKTRNYTDSLPYKTGFYRVAAIDHQGVKHYSFPAMILLPDSIPPSSPHNFSGQVDSTGIVKFSWDPNNESDLAGYRIFRSNYQEEGYQKINNELIVSTGFHDTLSLRTLTRKVYYKLAAIDKHYNESELTEVLIILRPDTIPPAPPSFTKYYVSENGIKLYWNRSPSDDVKDHLLFRRKTSDNQWIRVNPENDTTGTFTDTNIVNQVVYQYLVIAVDSNGLESEQLNPVSIRAYGTVFLNQPTDFKGRADQSGKSINLTWNTTYSGENAKISIYRAVDSNDPVLYRILPGDTREFIDRNVSIGVSYTYRLQVILTNGSKSALGTGITIGF